VGRAFAVGCTNSRFSPRAGAIADKTTGSERSSELATGVAINAGNASEWHDLKKSPIGLGPMTRGLRSCGHRMEGTQFQQVTSTPEVTCISLLESEHAGGSHGAGRRFADAVAAIMGLPLTDAEKAEAVRRLLADQAAGGDHDRHLKNQEMTCAMASQRCTMVTSKSTA
jgi:hypothetical protein